MKIELTHIQINDICDALNAQARTFDELILKRTGVDASTREVWATHARHLRETTNHILRQRQDAERVNA
jgi:hypothetical protein